MSNYQRIATVIRYLNQKYKEQPSLADLAAELQLSQHHFHRLFSTWAAVTPKDFLQCLTLSHAKRLLQEGHSVLDSALDSGLSGPGRLHDLCVSLEAATPGEIKLRGQGCDISFGFAESPFGTCLIAETTRGICHLSFVDTSEAEALEELQRHWGQAKLHRNDQMLAGIAENIFQPAAATKGNPPLKTFVQGSAFQVKVWRALLNIPPGTLLSYGNLASQVGNPGASRAVGTAVAQNQIAYLIPCHRVIRSTGIVGGYRWGTERKQAVIAWESTRTK